MEPTTDMNRTEHQRAIGIVRAETVKRQLTGRRRECVDIVRRAYLAHHDRLSANPESTFLRFPGRPRDRIIALPAYLGGDFSVAGIKWIASVPGNVERGLARASAALILNDLETGFPFALLESSLISAARTAASAELAATELHGGRSARALGVVGTGLIARHVYEFFLEAGWECERLVLFDLDRREADRFAREIARPERHGEIAVAGAVEELVTGCDVVLFATVAGEPHLFDPALFAHRPLVLHLSLRDLGPAVILAANNVVDDIDHVMRAETSPHLAERVAGDRRFLTGTLAQVIRGEVTLDPARPTIFSPFGLGILDIAVGSWIFELARVAGEVTTIADFLPADVR
jgi:N-[(2S)-2-amino-2-carboxyethyl]-L-glutamate dehydrogenase